MKVVGLQIQHQVHIRGEPDITMSHHGQSADDQIPHAGGRKRFENGFDAVSLHGAWNSTRGAPGPPLQDQRIHSIPPQ